MLSRRHLFAATAATALVGTASAAVALPATIGVEDVTSAGAAPDPAEAEMIPTLGETSVREPWLEGLPTHEVEPNPDVVLGMLFAAKALMTEFPGWELQCVVDDNLCHYWPEPGKPRRPPDIRARVVTIEIRKEPRLPGEWHDGHTEGAFVMDGAGVNELVAKLYPSASPAVEEQRQEEVPC